MSQNYLKFVSQFMSKVDRHVEKMLEELDTTGEYNEDCDIRIDVAGDKLEVPMNADSYSRLDSFLQAEMLEILEDDLYILERMEFVATMQTYVQEHCDESKEWFVTFKSFGGTDIVDPFLDESSLRTVQPLKYYNKMFLTSGWFTGKFDELCDRLRITALEYCQATDPNGCYTDENSKIEFGNVCSFEDAMVLFARDVCYDDMSEYEEMDLTEIQQALVNNNKFWNAMIMLTELMEAEDKQVFYRNIWNHGFDGWKAYMF